MKYIDNESHIIMVQQSANRWEIQTRKGYVLKADITVCNNHQAEEYVKDYLSSFRCWTYEVKPLPKGNKNGLV